MLKYDTNRPLQTTMFFHINRSDILNLMYLEEFKSHHIQNQIELELKYLSLQQEKITGVNKRK